MKLKKCNSLFKRCLLLGLCAMLVFSFVACEKNSDSGNTEQPDSVNTEQPDSGKIETYSGGTYGSRATQVVSFGKWDVYPFIMSVKTDNCTSFTFTLTLSDIEWGNPYGTWEVYCKDTNGEWIHIQDFEVQEDETTVTVTLKEPMTFTEVAVNRMSGESCKHKYELVVTEYSRYVE